MGRKCNEIRDLMDSCPAGQLSAKALEEIEGHVEMCPACAAALSATTAIGELFRIRAEAAEKVNPSPFFESIVMGALRARKAVAAPMSAFAQWWKATSSILAFSASASMVLMVVALMMTSRDETPTTTITSGHLYPPEAVMIDATSGKDLTNEQVLQVVYNPRYEERNNEQR